MPRTPPRSGSDPGSGRSRRAPLVASLLVVAALGGAFVALMVDVWETNALVGLDHVAQDVRRSDPADALLGDGAPLGFSGERPANEIVQLGDAKVVIPAAFLLALCALVLRDRIGALVAVGGPGVTGFLTEYVLKPLVNVPAPAGSRAFPSGHGGGIAGIALVVVVLVYRRWGWLPALLVAPFAAVPVLWVGSALLRLDFHYPTDVLGGGLLAATVIAAMTATLSLYTGPGHRLLRSGRTKQLPPSATSGEADPSVRRLPVG